MDLISEQTRLQILPEKERLNLILDVRKRRRERSQAKFNKKTKPKRTQKMLAGLNDEQLHLLLNNLRTGK
jgi:hypothetical protein